MHIKMLLDDGIYKLYILATLPEDRYPKQLFSQEWNIKPRRGKCGVGWWMISLNL